MRCGRWRRRDRNTDGEIVFAPTESGELFKVPAAGGVPARLTQLDPTRAEIGHAWPQFLPDGRHYLYLARSFIRDSPQRTGPAVSSFAIYVGSLDSGDHTLLVEGVPRAQYALGHLIFVRDTTLVAQAFDLASLQLHGDPEVIGGSIAVNTVNGRSGLNRVGPRPPVSDCGSVERRKHLVLVRTGRAAARIDRQSRGIQVHSPVARG